MNKLIIKKNALSLQVHIAGEWHVFWRHMQDTTKISLAIRTFTDHTALVVRTIISVI